MSKENEIEIIKEIQKSVQQMKLDDIEENPEAAFDRFVCSCCGLEKMLAGSIIYTGYHLCNECAVLAETGLKLQKFNSVECLIKVMEDKRFENIYNNLFDKDGESLN